MLTFPNEIQVQDFLLLGFVIKFGLYHLVELVSIIFNLEWLVGITTSNLISRG